MSHSTNATGVLDDVRDPAIDAKIGGAVRALTAAYRTSNALSGIASDSEYRATLDDVMARDAPFRNTCGS